MEMGSYPQINPTALQNQKRKSEMTSRLNHGVTERFELD